MTVKSITLTVFVVTESSFSQIVMHCTFFDKYSLHPKSV